MKKMAGKNMMAAMPEMSPEMDHHETMNHMKTLVDAHEIMQDKKKMKKVHKLSGRHHKAITSLNDLKMARDAFNDKDTDKDGE